LTGLQLRAAGLFITGSHVTVRGFNVHSFNSSQIFVPAPANNVQIVGNYVGTDPTGRTAKSTGNFGVSFSGSTNSRLGGPNLSDRNVISGLGVHAVEVAVNASEITLQNNYIGVDATGATALPNGQGVTIVSSSHVYVGADGVGNVISGNTNGGLWIYADSSVVTVESNSIGTNALGTASLGNGSDEIFISESQDITIGGGTADERNFISGNNVSGISIENGSSQVFILGNHIANNGFDGVEVLGATAQQVVLRGNSIFGNGELGIDLDTNGVTANDPLDADSGPNGVQNFPVITSVISTAESTTISGSLNSIANATFDLEFFANKATASADAEGELLIATASVTTDANGMRRLPCLSKVSCRRASSSQRQLPMPLETRQNFQRPSLVKVY